MIGLYNIDDEHVKLLASHLYNCSRTLRWMSPKRLVSYSTSRGKEPAHSYVAEVTRCKFV